MFQSFNICCKIRIPGAFGADSVDFVKTGLRMFAEDKQEKTGDSCVRLLFSPPEMPAIYLYS